MNYRNIIKTVAIEYDTTYDEVEKEINKAIRAAGYNMSPELFIALCTAKVKKTINSN